jgi:hypothetical protein
MICIEKLEEKTFGDGWVGRYSQLFLMIKSDDLQEYEKVRNNILKSIAQKEEGK